MKIVKRKTEYTVLELPEIGKEVKVENDELCGTFEFMSRDLGSLNDHEWEDTSVDTLIDYLDDQSPAVVANLLRDLATLLSPPTKPRKASKR